MEPDSYDDNEGHQNGADDQDGLWFDQDQWYIAGHIPLWNYKGELLSALSIGAVGCLYPHISYLGFWDKDAGVVQNFLNQQGLPIELAEILEIRFWCRALVAARHSLQNLWRG
jgi:hypothetical protein